MPDTRCRRINQILFFTGKRRTILELKKSLPFQCEDEDVIIPVFGAFRKKSLAESANPSTKNPFFNTVFSTWQEALIATVRNVLGFVRPEFHSGILPKYTDSFQLHTLQINRNLYDSVEKLYA